MALCPYILPNNVEECRFMVENYFDDIVEWLLSHPDTPQELCEMLTLCKAGSTGNEASMAAILRKLIK